MIQLNHPDRDKVEPLTVEEEKELIEGLNTLNIFMYTKEEELLQRLISNYENLLHYKSYTSNYDLLVKKVENLEDKLAASEYDCTLVNEMRMKEVKKNEALISALKNIMEWSADLEGESKDQGNVAKQAIENNK